MTLSEDRVRLRDQLQTGRRELITRFRKSPPCTIGAGKLLAAGIKSRAAICHLVAGWACQNRDFSDGHQAILDIYLPGDVIGLDSVLRTRALNSVLTLTSIAIEVIDAEDAMLDLMTRGSTALYIAWLLGQRQQRADRLLGAISSLDARGRLAAMVLDFFERLSRRGLVTGTTYNLPLNQAQMGAYLGLTVAHINRVLRSLREERIANVENHAVTIFDVEGLKRLARDGRIAAAPADRAA
jgi:CRP/FNR family transcriptional regulator, anaerobic regulatory protein